MKLEQLGPYRIVKQIGKGGMGSVYEAVCDDSGADAGTRVAIKALSPQLAMAEGFRERFEAEIDSLKKLKHAGIVRLFGYGEQDGLLFYSMELVDGPSLEEEINDGRRFSWRETLRIGIQICRALKHAHDHGVVHRDIKPANLMLTADHQIKIADFGIARLFGGTQLTTAGGVLGTADYMSPEQADGRTVTEKCDQYSLGGVMFALLAGRPPFRAKTMPEMLQLQRFAEPEPVRRYAIDTPDQLDRLITQLLAKEPAERFPNVLVLSRHMEAMEKALSRPPKPQVESDDPANDNPTGALPPTPLDLTLGRAQAATRVLDSPVVLHENTLKGEANPDLYDAPTLDQPSESESSLAKPVSLLGHPIKVVDEQPATTSTAPAPATHYTTVDEDARRQRELGQGNRWVMAAQLGGLLATLGLLIWGGWQLMKPPTADELYASINADVEEEDLSNLSRKTAEHVESFLNRFADDPRAKELQPLKEQLEFQKYEKVSRMRSRFAGNAALSPIEQVYFDALTIAEDDPTQAISMLRALLALYDPADRIVNFEAASSLADEFKEFGDPRLLVTARQRIEQFREQLQSLATAQLPALRARLAKAATLEKSNPAQAKRMYQAIVKLYGDQAWAREAVEKARRKMTNDKRMTKSQ